MSQIDKIIYIPLLFWFCILFGLLYFIIFSYFLSNFFYMFFTRELYFENLINFLSNMNTYFELFKNILENLFISTQVILRDVFVVLFQRNQVNIASLVWLNLLKPLLIKVKNIKLL